MRTATWYHASLKPIGRSAGRSAVACAAYRTGTSMQDTRYGATRDFSRKSDVVTSFTLAPEGSPAWAFDAEQLWNAAEARENRKNSQLAFEWEVALPNELSAPQREAIAHDFANWLVEEYGVAVTAGIHEGGNRGNGKNDHMHVMMTTRAVGPAGWDKNKLRDFNARPGNDNPEVERVREQIAVFINEALADAGSDERVDHRSFEARGITHVPTKHLGPAGMARERLDGSDRGDINRAIIEERLRWQLEQGEPEISPAAERELLLRFDDWQPLRRGAVAADLADAPTLAHGAPAATDEEHTGWRRFVDRVRAFQAKAAEFWHDETSGAPEGERGVAARLFDAGARLFVGFREGKGMELAEGIEQTADLALDLATRRAGEASGDSGKQPKTFTERIRDEAVALWRNQRGMVPDDDFDRMAAEWTPGPEPDAEPPPSAAPEPDIPERDGPDIA